MYSCLRASQHITLSAAVVTNAIVASSVHACGTASYMYARRGVGPARLCCTVQGDEDRDGGWWATALTLGSNQLSGKGPRPSHAHLFAKASDEDTRTSLNLVIEMDVV